MIHSAELAREWPEPFTFQANKTRSLCSLGNSQGSGSRCRFAWRADERTHRRRTDGPGASRGPCAIIPKRMDAVVNQGRGGDTHAVNGHKLFQAIKDTF